MSIESEREALLAALRFYADPENWEGRQVDHVDGMPEVTVQIFDEDGVRTVDDFETWESGPAVDGGAFARDVIELLARGEL